MKSSPVTVSLLLDNQELLDVLKLFGACLLVRGVCFLFSQNVSWDAVSRSWQAMAWSQSPFIVPPLDGAGQYGPQYGPLPLYLFGLGLKIFPNLLLTPRLINLFIGSACIIPFYFWVKTAFSPKTAVTSSYLFIFYTLQAKSSVLAASEPLFVFCWLFSLYYFYRYLNQGNQRKNILICAGFLNLAGMCRYNGWFYIPLLGLIALKTTRHEGKWKNLVLFILVCLIFPVIWMAVCGYYYHDPLYPIRFVRQDHLRVIAQMGGVGLFMRIYYLFFFPVVLALSLSFPTFWQSLKAVGEAVKERKQSGVILIGSCSAAYLVYLAALRGNFLLFSRFAMEAGIVLIPFAVWKLEEPLYTVQRQPVLDFHTVKEFLKFRTYLGGNLLITGAAVSFCLVALGGFFLPGALGRRISSVSPIARLSVSQKRVSEFIREKISPQEMIVIPHTFYWEEVEIKFYSRHPLRNFPRYWNTENPPHYIIVRKGKPITIKGKGRVEEANPLFKKLLDTLDFRVFKVNQRVGKD